MSPKVITFDCAKTLMDARWEPASLAIGCAEHLGHPVNRERAAAAYQNLLATRWAAYQELNLARDPVVIDGFWRELTSDWMNEVGVPMSALEDLLAEADRQLFGPESKVFPLYDDVLPTLRGLRERGQRMAVISNWDVTLHRALAMHGLTEYFEVVIASLEHGVEKPDPRLFHLTLDQLQVQPDEVLHVGDNPLDDLAGARGAGLQALLIDREAPQSGPSTIVNLTELLDRI